MCKDCGCGNSAQSDGSGGKGVHTHRHVHEHEYGTGSHDGEHPHEHTHLHTLSEGSHTHTQGAEERPGPTEGVKSGTAKRRTIQAKRSLLEKNERLAERNRGYFRGCGLLVLNVLSSPGSGKTTLLQETLRRLGERLKAAVIVGDLATDNDARRLRETGAPVIQITTGTMCHLEAEMIGRAAAELDLKGRELLIIENVGNLVCPASYDLGEGLRVVLLSVTEGEDKPLKYPPVFQSADVVVVSKIDLAEACGLNREELSRNLRKAAPRADILELSARTGTGMEKWCEWLIQRHREANSRHPLA